MGGGYEPRLKLGRSKVDAPLQHGVEVPSVLPCVGLLHLGQSFHRAAGEEPGEHGLHPVDAPGNLGPLEHSGDPIGQPLGQRIQTFVDSRLLQFLQRGNPRGYSQRVAGQGARLVHRPERSHLLHDLPPPAVGAHRQPAPYYLAQGGDVGGDPIQRLRPAIGNPESGDDLVKDQHRSLLLRNPPQSLEEPLGGRHHSHVPSHRLHDDAGHIPRVFLEIPLHRCQVVVVGHQGFLRVGIRHSRAGGDAVGHRPRSGPHQKPVGVAVVAARELDDLVASRVGASQADGAHAGLGPGTHQPDAVHRRQRLAYHLRQLHLPFCRCAKAGAVARGLPQRFHHCRMGMAQGQRPPRAYIVDVLVSVHIPDPAALPPGDEGGRPLHGAE